MGTNKIMQRLLSDKLSSISVRFNFEDSVLSETIDPAIGIVTVSDVRVAGEEIFNSESIGQQI